MFFSKCGQGTRLAQDVNQYLIDVRFWPKQECSWMGALDPKRSLAVATSYSSF